MRLKCLLFFILNAAVIFTRQVNGARILGLFPLNGKSHFVMFQEVMKSLADRGHRVDVLSTFPLENPYPNYKDLSLADFVPVMVNNMSYQFVQMISGSSEKFFIEVTGNSICEFFEFPVLQELIKNPPKDPPYDLVIAELFYANCYFAFGRHLNVPVIGLTSSPMLPYTNQPLGNPLNPAYVPEIVDGSIFEMNFWQRLKNTVTTWSMCFQSRFYTKGQSETIYKHFGAEMPDVRQLERELALVLVNSHYTLNGIRPFTPAVVEVGGLHVRDNNNKELPSELKKWLDESKDGFIYCSFGSMVTIESFPEETLKEIYEAFSKIAPIRVLMKVAKPESLPAGLPINVITLTWVPQIKILKHKNIRAFITHGGLMGVQEAVTFGVPLIGIPLFRDQPINIKTCSDKKAGILLPYEDLKSEKIIESINAIVYNPEYKKNMMKLSAQFLDRPMSARDTAIFWIEYILRHGSDSLRSPATKLEWWQVSLFDVYGFIIAVLFITLYLVKLILSMIIYKILYTYKTTSTRSKKNN